ncbi:hypothetical protein CF326_g7836 [Tilletia indica]|nr:hypothetical protein CF326_g7836 [Tilletia indica]
MLSNQIPSSTIAHSLGHQTVGTHVGQSIQPYLPKRVAVDMQGLIAGRKDIDPALSVSASNITRLDQSLGRLPKAVISEMDSRNPELLAARARLESMKPTSTSTGLQEAHSEYTLVRRRVMRQEHTRWRQGLEAQQNNLLRSAMNLSGTNNEETPHEDDSDKEEAPRPSKGKVRAVIADDSSNEDDLYLHSDKEEALPLNKGKARAVETGYDSVEDDMSDMSDISDMSVTSDMSVVEQPQIGLAAVELKLVEFGASLQQQTGDVLGRELWNVDAEGNNLDRHIKLMIDFGSLHAKTRQRYYPLAEPLENDADECPHCPVRRNGSRNDDKFAEHILACAKIHYDQMALDVVDKHWAGEKCPFLVGPWNKRSPCTHVFGKEGTQDSISRHLLHNHMMKGRNAKCEAKLSPTSRCDVSIGSSHERREHLIQHGMYLALMPTPHRAARAEDNEVFTLCSFCKSCSTWIFGAAAKAQHDRIHLDNLPMKLDTRLVGYLVRQEIICLPCSDGGLLKTFRSPTALRKPQASCFLPCHVLHGRTRPM